VGILVQATLDISIDAGGSLLVASSAVDEAIRGVYFAEEYNYIYPDKTKTTILWSEELISNRFVNDVLFKDLDEFEEFNQRELVDSLHTNEINFFVMSDAIVARNGGHHENPGISMPLSFVRRFMTQSELLVCNCLLEDLSCGTLVKVAKEGNSIEDSGGIIPNSCLVMITIDLLEDFTERRMSTIRKRDSMDGGSPFGSPYGSPSFSDRQILLRRSSSPNVFTRSGGGSARKNSTASRSGGSSPMTSR